MDPQLRRRFNADFAPEKYATLLRCVNQTEKWPADFRISETSIFLTREFTDEVTRAAHEIVALTRTLEFARHAENAIPEGLEVPRESAHPNFLVVDFAICAEGDRLVPRLIELQAFPSLFGFQLLLLHCVRKAYRNQRRGISRSVKTHDHRRFCSGERHTSGDRARETKDADRFRSDRNLAWHSSCLRDENHETRPATVL